LRLVFASVFSSPAAARKETEWAKVCEDDRYYEGDRSQKPFLLDNNAGSEKSRILVAMRIDRVACAPRTKSIVR